MWRRAVVLLLILLVTLGDATWTQQSRQARQARETNSCEGRQSPGPICESCELLATCIRHSNGWVNIPVETCDTQNGFYCNARLGSCSNATGPCHPFSFEGNFPCTSHGVFPDPYDCQKYHMCYFVGATLVSASVDCGNDKAFNPATGQCSLTIAHPICQQRQFECLNAGDAHAWPLNPNIFYICKATSSQDERVLYPTLYRCADGEVFVDYYCRSTRPTEPLPNNTLAPTAPPANTATSTAASVTEAPRTCKKLGLFADKQNCHKYYYCSAVAGVMKHLTCPVGTYFNEALSSCILGNC